MVIPIIQAANPLPFLLDEEKHGDHQATEALFLTYNVDLGFFEARALGVCIAAGARVCVVADASVWNPDLYAVKHAGRDYHVGLATAPGAFHPKVVAIVGPKRVVVAIGSGNLTMGGWQHNAETWTILRGDTVIAPAVLADVATALEDISASNLDRITSAATARTAQGLRSMLEHTSHVEETGHRVLSTTRGSILNQLAGTRAEDMWLYAPFHDPAARGTAAVLERMRPERVTVMIQPGWTVLDPQALELVLRKSGAEWQVVRDAEAPEGAPDRYRHGKLVEWTTHDGRRIALTGSANLSYAALVAPVGTGNIEIAVLSPVDETLFPKSVPVDVGDVPHVAMAAGDDERRGGRETPRVRSALLVDGGLEVLLTATLRSDEVLEASQRAETPNTWAPLCTLKAGTSQIVVHLIDPLPANSRIRLRPAPNAQYGSVVFVTDPERVLRRLTSGAASRTARHRAPDLWDGDIATINAFASDLADLAADVAATRPPLGRREHDSDHEVSHREADTDTAPWLWLQDQTATHHGQHLAAFALGIPAPPDAGGGERLPWEDLLVGDDEVELVTDTAERIDADRGIPEGGTSAEDSPPPDHRRDQAEVRRARRRLLAKWVQAVDSVPVASSLIVLRLALVWWSAGDWDREDPEPHLVVESLLRKVVARDTHRMRQLDARVASLGIVALTMLGNRIVPGAFTETTLRFAALRDAVSYLVLDAHEDLVGEYCRLLKNPTGAPLDPEQVMQNVRAWGEADPLTDAINVAESAGSEVTRTGPRLLRVEGTFGNAEAVVLRLVDLVPNKALPVGVWAVNDRGAWAFAAWDRPDLVLAIHSVGGTTRWRHQRLPRHLGPLASSAPDGLIGVVRHGRTDHEFAEAKTLLGKLGLSSPEPF